MEKLIWNEKWVLLINESYKDMEIIELEDLKSRKLNKENYKLDLVENLTTYKNYKVMVNNYNNDYELIWLTVDEYLKREKKDFLNTLSFTEEPKKLNRVEWNDNFILLIDKENRDVNIIEACDLHLRSLKEEKFNIDLIENLSNYKDYLINEAYIINDTFIEKTLTVKYFLDNGKRDFINNLNLDEYFV